MKKYLLFAAFFYTHFLHSENCFVTNVDTINFDTISIHQKYVSKTILLTNVDTKPLVIKDIRGRCSCISANWEKKPISVNDSSSIDILYKNWSTGYFYKKVKIITSICEKHIIVKGYSRRKD